MLLEVAQVLYVTNIVKDNQKHVFEKVNFEIIWDRKWF
jgi:hypothetical protein